MSFFQRLLSLVLAGSIFLSSTSYAWNYLGHVVVAEIAHDNLNPQVKNKADQLAALIYYQLPVVQQAKLDRQYPNASIFAKVAMLPDTWKKWQLGGLFHHFHASLPMNLLWYSTDRTSDWHFIDQPYPVNSLCRTVKDQNVVWALQKLKVDFSSKRSDNTNAVLMVLTEHLVGDLHQPLHTMTNVTLNCNGDGGGNTFCLKTNSRTGECAINLHMIWDNAAGYLKPKRDITLYARTLEMLYPKAQLTRQNGISNFTQIATDNYQHAEFVYNIHQGDKPAPKYYKTLQSIAKSQLAKAGYTLADELNQDLAQ